MIRRTAGALLVAGIVGFVAQPAKAVVTTWTVQSSSSSLTLSGSLSSGGTFLADVQSQAGGNGLTTSYFGSITSEQTIVNSSPSDIAFISADLNANTSGNWDPLPGGATGTSPGDYGGRVLLGPLGGANLVIRDLIAGLTSGSIALTGNAFDTQTFSGDVVVELLSATADYRGFGVVGGALGGGSLTDGIAGQSGLVAAAGSINYGPGEYAGTATLSIPVNFTFAAIVAGEDTTDVGDDIGVYINLLGALVATAPTATVPEASSLVLLGLAGSVVGFVGYRRKAKASA